MIRKIFLLNVLLIFISGVAMAQSTSFNYQGSLKTSGSPANGNFDLQFLLFDAVLAGSQVGSTLNVNAVPVVDGTFSVSLDFGSQFPGTNRFLEIRVQPTGGGGFTALAPRQLIATTPYAQKSLTADNAATAGNATQLGGVAAGQYVITGDARLSDARTPTAGSANYIQNQNAAPQAASNFNISGNGTANILTAGTQFNLGGSRILSNGGTENLFAGTGAGASNTVGRKNSFFGTSAGTANSDGEYNSFFGASAGQATQSGTANSFFGTEAGRSNIGGAGNSYFGRSAGLTSVSTIGNSFFGWSAGSGVVNGGLNTYLGYLSGGGDVSGNFNSALGSYATVEYGDLTNATAIGARAMVSSNNSLVLGSVAGANGATVSTRVGIGTTSPAYTLHVVAPGDAMIGLSYDAAGIYGLGKIGVRAGAYGAGIALKTYGTSWFQGDTTPLNIAYAGSGPGIMIGSGGALGYIAAYEYSPSPGPRQLALNVSGGNVSVGGANALRTLHVNGRVRIDSAPVEPSVASVCFTNQGDVVQCGASSLRWKSNVHNYTDGLNVIRQLRPISYNWKDGGAFDIGLGAEDVARTAPFFTYRDKEGVVEGVRYDRLNMVVINSINEQQAQIEAQQKQIAAQQKQIEQQNSINNTLALELAALKALVCLGNQEAAACKAKK